MLIFLLGGKIAFILTLKYRPGRNPVNGIMKEPLRGDARRYQKWHTNLSLDFLKSS